MDRRHLLRSAGAALATGGLSLVLPATSRATTVEDGYLYLDQEEHRALVDALQQPYVPAGDTEPYYRLVAPQPVRQRLRAVQLAFVSQGLAAGGYLPLGVWLYPHAARCAITLRTNYELRRADL